MSSPAFIALLEAARSAHAHRAALQEFCAFPSDLMAQSWTPYSIPAAAKMIAETGWRDEPDVPALFNAFLSAAPDAQWRETYKDTEIGQDFLDRFGCYCLIGPGAPWISRQMYAFLVYMPPGLWYPWHEHPAEELYYVLAGSGEFFCDGASSQVLKAGQASFHPSGRPHALRTHDRPLMAYVLWRNHFETPPVLTPGRSLRVPAVSESVA